MPGTIKSVLQAAKQSSRKLGEEFKKNLREKGVSILFFPFNYSIIMASNNDKLKIAIMLHKNSCAWMKQIFKYV